MSSRSKFPPKAKKSKQASKSSPESPDEFQAAADAEEETGGKWRAGDKAKSCRAFLRAIEIYERGLTRHPRDFDLAYNKARLEFEVSQQPNLVAKLPVSPQDFLQQALKSHKYALSLNEGNADILFNTAQLLISLAELAEEESDGDGFDPALPVAWLREALELLSACFSRQEMLYEEQMQAWNDRDEGEDGGVSLSSETRPASRSSTGANRTEQSATVQSAVTPDDLIDTSLASVSALNRLVALDMSDTQTLASMAQAILTKKLPQLLPLLAEDDRTDRAQEAALAQASFAAALSHAEHSIGSISAETYVSRLSIFETLDLSDTEIMCDYADALIEFSSATLPTVLSDPSALPASYQVLQKALQLYEQAATHLSTPTGSKKDADGALSLSLVPKIDTEQEQRLGAVQEAIGDARLMVRRVLIAMSDAGAASPNGADAREEAMRYPRLADGAYDAAQEAYGRAGDEIAAGKVVVRRIVAGGVGGKAAEVTMRELSKYGDKGLRTVRNLVDEEVIGREWLQVIGG
ncbi:UPF0656 protein [Sphaceloma murrayae]|uniref:UPF0656 protein n=1 Tax=Sphaceloma murrayae TaxID=2082308 RepID=A0A2K1R2D6_9PEZI|nr:UPF0656 protein [Sphaceloma murrayae]